MDGERKGVKIGLEYELEIRDKQGKLISKTRRESHSFVRNFIRMLKIFFGRIESESLPNTAGGTSPFYGYTPSCLICIAMSVNAGSGSEAYGIRVGTSSQAFSREDYELIERITHGTGEGQLLYGATMVEEYAETDSEAYFRFTRTFTNNSGSAVTVREIGVAIRQKIGNNNYYFLIARDVLDTPQEIPDGATLTVRYRILITYS